MVNSLHKKTRLKAFSPSCRKKFLMLSNQMSPQKLKVPKGTQRNPEEPKEGTQKNPKEPRGTQSTKRFQEELKGIQMVLDNIKIG